MGEIGYIYNHIYIYCEWAFAHTGNGLPTCKALKRVFQPRTAQKSECHLWQKVLGYAKSAKRLKELPGSELQKGGHAHNVCKMAQHCYPTQPSARGPVGSPEPASALDMEKVIPGSWLG